MRNPFAVVDVYAHDAHGLTGRVVSTHQTLPAALCRLRREGTDYHVVRLVVPTRPDEVIEVFDSNIEA